MALSCFLKLSSQSTIRGQHLKSLSSQLLKICPAVANSRYYHQILTERDQKASLLTKLQSPIILAPSKLFSETKILKIGEVRLEDSHKGHSHVTLWKLERILSVVLIPLVPLAFISPGKGLDVVLALCIVMHNHWGLEALVIDYLRPQILGPSAPKIGMALLYVLSIVMLAGLLNLTFNDIGLANSLKALWSPPTPEPTKKK